MWVNIGRTGEQEIRLAGVDGGAKLRRGGGRIRNRLWTLPEEFHPADPARVRELLRRVVRKISLWFGEETHGSRTFYSRERGLIELCPDPIISGLVGHDSRGDWI